MRTSWKSVCGLLLSAVLLCGIVSLGAAPRSNQQMTINGVVFTLPQRYARLPAASRQNSVFLYDRKYRDGMVVTVPSVPFVEQDVLNNLMKDSQKIFFPKETLPYQWKSSDSLQKVSKFEVKDTLAKGFNKRHLLVFEYRHIIFNQRDVFVGTIFEARKGKPAQEMFDGEGTAMSMSTCGASAELIYSLTGEKIDPDRRPCELIANVP
ncbi:MAG: hypothetical protein QOH42_48 [Blastocatellia bacterium]|nr:hypothetical protein [Blastocatellia bacterium]